MLIRTFMPRVSETVAAKHIRHDVIPIWLAESSLEIHKMFSPDIQRDPRLIMANINLDYITETLWGRDVEVTTGVRSIGNSSFVLMQNVYQDSRLCAKAFVTFIHFNYSTHKSESIPQEIRLKLEEHLIKE